MMFHPTFQTLVPVAAWLGLTYGGPVMLAAAVLFLAVPALRRRPGLRRTAYGLLGVLPLLAVAALPYLVSTLEEWRQQRAYDARTHILASPQSFGGIALPAGSTVHLSEDGVPESGSVPATTTILGLPLAGAFQLGAEDGTGLPVLRSGVLAVAAEVQGIPCAPGPIVLEDHATRCTLARDWTFAGHLLAGGTVLEVYRSPLGEPPQLRFGSLAGPELLYDVRWPAGTVVGPVDAPPERMAHGPGPESLVVGFCLPSGVTADIGGAVLHGFMSLDVQGDRRLVSPVCSALAEGRVGTDGFAQVGGDRFTWGERAGAASPWQWSIPFKPGG